MKKITQILILLSKSLRGSTSSFSAEGKTYIKSGGTLTYDRFSNIMGLISQLEADKLSIVDFSMNITIDSSNVNFSIEMLYEIPVQKTFSNRTTIID